MEIVMRNLFPITVTATLILSGAGAAAAELPIYELAGFPITPHQFSVVGSAYVQEQSPNIVEIEPSRLGFPGLALTLAGMPGAPHKIAVLALGTQMTVAAGH